MPYTPWPKPVFKDPFTPNFIPFIKTILTNPPPPEASYLAEGVLADGSTNNIYVNPEKYWSQFSNWTNEIHDPFVYDASYVKLREVTLTWELPSKWLSPVKIKKFYLSIYGRNLWLLYSQVPNIDPEAFHDSENGMGYELYSYPGRRNIGFNLKFNF